MCIGCQIHHRLEQAESRDGLQMKSVCLWEMASTVWRVLNLSMAVCIARSVLLSSAEAASSSISSGAFLARARATQSNCFSPAHRRSRRARVTLGSQKSRRADCQLIPPGYGTETGYARGVLGMGCVSSILAFWKGDFSVLFSFREVKTPGQPSSSCKNCT